MGTAFIQIASNLQAPWSETFDRCALSSCTLVAMCCKNDPQQEVTLVMIEPNIAADASWCWDLVK
jgi:hypothetical protein